jgi:hypothetical protein
MMVGWDILKAQAGGIGSQLRDECFTRAIVGRIGLIKI